MNGLGEQSDPETIAVSDTLTAQDVLRANMLFYRRINREPWRKAVLGVVLVGVTAYILSGILADRRPPLASLNIFGAIGVAFLLAALLLGLVVSAIKILNRFLVKRMSMQNYREQAALQKPFSIRATKEGITFFREGSGHSMTPWAEFLRWSANEQVMLLYFSRRLYTMLPTRLLNDDEIYRIQNWMNDAGVPRF